MAPFPERPLSVISSAATTRSSSIFLRILEVRYLNAGAAPSARHAGWMESASDQGIFDLQVGTGCTGPPCGSCPQLDQSWRVTMKLPSMRSRNHDLMYDPFRSLRREMEDMFRVFDRNLPSLHVGAGVPTI